MGSTISFVLVLTFIVGIITALVWYLLNNKLGPIKNYKVESVLAANLEKNFETLDEVWQYLKKNGLEVGDLIIAIDFTSSNDWSGRKSFNGQSLHKIEHNELNPYQEALYIIYKSLQAYNINRMIPCFGFGCASTRDHSVFSFLPDEVPCNGIVDAERHYRLMAKNVTLSGPTSLAPIINKAIEIVYKQKSFYILLIIADGQVTHETETMDAIVKASQYPLSIVMIGVGDGPWDAMKLFVEKIPKRSFNNFQFVDMNAAMASATESGRSPAVAFALQALVHIPAQYTSVKRLGLLQANHELPEPSSKVTVVPPPATFPPEAYATDINTSKHLDSTTTTTPVKHYSPSSHGFNSPSNGQRYAPNSPSNGQRYVPNSPSNGQRYAPNSPSYHNDSDIDSSKKSALDFSTTAKIEAIRRRGVTPPQNFFCPITQEVMRDPVICSDGHTYERHTIEGWIRTKNTSPMTNQRLNTTRLISNHNLKTQIKAWIVKYLE